MAQCSECGSTERYANSTICNTEGCTGFMVGDDDPTATKPGGNTKDTNPKDAIGATKAPLGLFPSTALVAGAMAFLEGATKYGRYNWRVAGVRASIYRDALGRHIEAWWNGEDLDPDSGLPHLWKALACIAILIDSDEADKLTDDRPPRVDVAGMIQRWTPLVEEIKERNKNRNPKQYTIRDSEWTPTKCCGGMIEEGEDGTA